jgi:hypothetical protein
MFEDLTDAELFELADTLLRAAVAASIVHGKASRIATELRSRFAETYWVLIIRF